MDTQNKQEIFGADNSSGKDRYDMEAKKRELANKYQHINGWGIDADPKDFPNYPMKHYTGADHQRSNYEKPPQQPLDVEVLHSNERPSVSAVFGNTFPPKGISGWVRRKAFNYSEESLKHWFALVLADRINVVEGIVDDLRNSYVPNIFAEKGWGADMKYNKKAIVKKVAVMAIISTVVVVLLTRKKKLRHA
jgi:hypothetical protein